MQIKHKNVQMMESSFKPASFLANSNMYEVNIRQYTVEGTFNAFANHLPRLKDMGVDILWFMPIHPIGKENRKGSLGSYYSISDYKTVNPEFGSETDFKNLITQIHTLGMKVVIDWVANHAAWDNVWTITNPDFFLRDENGNFKRAFDWDDVIQINHESESEQAAMIDAMKHWVTHYDIDGFRADLAHLTPLQFWKNARTQITTLKPDLIWLAETEEIAYHEAFDMSYTWKWMHTVELFCKKEKSLADCIDVLEWYKNDFPTQAQRLFFTTNHDENTWNGTEFEKYGNNAKALAVFACTYPGVPLVYSGQELPNTRRLAFFDKDTIEWTPDIALEQFYKTLLNIRKTNSVFKNDNSIYIANHLLSKNILGYKISNGENEIHVLLNLGDDHFAENMILPNVHTTFRNVFTDNKIKINGMFFIDLKAGDFLVLEKII
jgi:alpha-amylase